MGFLFDEKSRMSSIDLGRLPADKAIVSAIE